MPNGSERRNGKRKSLDDIICREIDGDTEREIYGADYEPPDRIVPIARHGNVVIMKRVTGDGQEIRERAVIVGKEAGCYILRKENGKAIIAPITPATRKWFDRGETYVLRGNRVRAKNGSIAAYTTDRSPVRNSDARVLDWCRRHDISGTKVRYVEKGGRIIVTSIDGKRTRVRIR